MKQMFGLINTEGKVPETKQDNMTTALLFSTYPGPRADQHGSALLCLHASMHEKAPLQGSDVWLSYTDRQALISPTYRLTLVVPEEQHEDSPRKYWTPILHLRKEKALCLFLERVAGNFPLVQIEGL